MNETIPKEKNETLKGLYSVIADTSSKPGNCPTDENMAAFIDHQLKGKNRQAILKHLNQCPNCYKEWMLTCASIESLSAFKQKPVSVSKKIRQKITGFQPIWLIGLPAMAVSAILVMLIIEPFANSVKKQISDIYTLNIASSDLHATTIKTIPLPWEKTYLGFDQSALSLASRAYGAGLWDGRTDLLKTLNQPFPEKPLVFQNMTWLTNEGSDYYDFGRWSVFFWAILKSGKNIQSWQAYKSIQTSFVANFSKYSTKDLDAQEALSTLGDLNKLLIIAEQTQNQSDLNNLVRGLENTMYRLGPDHL